MNLATWQDQLHAIMREAGTKALSYYEPLPGTCTAPLERQYKKAGGFVTEADLAIEQYLIEALTQLCPEAGILAEESGARDERRDYMWVVDPIDGTTNFAHGIGYFCISIALTHHGKPIIGAVYDPLTERFFYARSGQGASCNGRELAISETQTAKRVVSVGVPYRRAQWSDLMPIVQRICTQAYSVRHFGAIALDLAHVAAGNLDGAVFFRLSWWDIAAGVLLVQEAGGRITDFQGGTVGPEYQSCVAGNSAVYAQLMQEVSQKGG